MKFLSGILFFLTVFAVPLQADDSPPATLTIYYFDNPPHFYRGEDGDIRDRLADIDTSRCPLYLLTGEYDYSVSPEDTRAAAQRIPGVKFSVMPKLGHFPMS